MRSAWLRKAQEPLRYKIAALDDSSKLLRVQIMVNNRSTKVALDSCACVSIADKSLFADDEIYEDASIVLTSASGDRLNVLGSANIYIKIADGMVLLQKVYVVKNLPWPVLLGSTFLRPHKVHLNYEEEEASFKFMNKKIAWPFLFGENNGDVNYLFSIRQDIFSSKLNEENNLIKIRLSKDIVLDPQMCHYVPSEVVCNKNAPGLFEPSFRLTYRGFEGVPGFVEAGTEISGVWLQNTSRRAKKLLAGTLLGTLSCADLAEMPAVQTINAVTSNEEISYDINPDLQPEQQKKLRDLLSQYRDVFAANMTEMGRTDALEHVIDVGNAEPIAQRPYRRSMKEKEIIDQQIEEMLAADVIRASNSPWCSPIVVVKKKDGGHRFAVDYRALNAKTKKDKFPVPNIEDLLSKLGGSKYFTSLDMFSSYFQVPIAERSREYTAFSDGSKLWEFNCLSFGLCNAPATFTRMAAGVFKEVDNLLVYIDDLLSYHDDFDAHVAGIKAVLDQLRAH